MKKPDEPEGSIAQDRKSDKGNDKEEASGTSFKSHATFSLLFLLPPFIMEKVSTHSSLGEACFHGNEHRILLFFF